MDDQNKNLILATALSFLVLLGWFLSSRPRSRQVAADGTGGGRRARPAPDERWQRWPIASVPQSAATRGAHRCR